MEKNALLVALGVLTIVYIAVWIVYLRRTFSPDAPKEKVKLAPQLGIGFFANFMDTLGVGSFAITSSIYKLFGLVQDDLIPGTMNIGHALPTAAEAFLFIGVAIVPVEFPTLVSMIAAAVVGAWVGAGTVSRWPKRRIQVGLGIALFCGALLMLGSILNWFPGGGTALGLTGTKLIVAVAFNFLFGALQQLGIGLYAPCMILIYLMGMNPLAAFPIMMGSCAFLMPVGGFRFIKEARYSPKAAIGLAIGGVPGVLLAYYVVKSLPLLYVRWLVVFVVLYTSAMLLRSAATESAAEANSRSHAPEPAGK
jgi:uncharacterized membrane protein YfcA